MLLYIIPFHIAYTKLNSIVFKARLSLVDSRQIIKNLSFKLNSAVSTIAIHTLTLLENIITNIRSKIIKISGIGNKSEKL